MSQMIFPQADLQAVAVVHQVILPPPTPENTSILLDIDLFREGHESVETAEIWKLLDQLRDRKNELFEACLTDKTRERSDP
jgi:uncharacterized protein (TIGR04255 family)